MCLHGFMETWRTWELVLPALEQRHDVLALTLPGHAGGPPLAQGAGVGVLVDAVAHAMDEAGVATAHFVGSSLGGYLALQLSARGRARSVVALAPAGGWAQRDESFKELLDYQRMVQEESRAAAPYADAIVGSASGRRRATKLIVESFEHIPPELIAHLLSAVAGCAAAVPLIEYARDEHWTLDTERISCPVRIVWGAEDKLLPWPSAAARFADDWLPHADWVVLEGVGHCLQLDAPLETAQLVVGFTAS